ncbi:MAG: NAD(P)/FAD-dependent oxidoreductase [Proteobacteria bacterium]|nr:NAD(P)/FAD-dependent oxidoreductase [Pseudomonadota bacterium]
MQTYVEQETADKKPNFPGYMIDRAAFDANLVADATAAGAECRLETMVRAVDDSGHIFLAGGERIRPRLIIGADGPRSLIGRAIGVRNTELVETRQVSVRLCGTYAATDIFLSASIPGGYGWMFPKRDTANVGVGVSAHRKDELKSLVADLHERLASEGRVGRTVFGVTGGAIPVGGLIGPVGALQQTPVLLAGDAAGLANPITGAGINAAVLSGALAGEAALSWLSGSSAALGEYGDEVQELFGPGLVRALRHRQRINTYFDSGDCPSPADLRHSWIAYETYWKL